MRTLRAGLIGLGVMGRNHARVVSAVDRIELVGIADPCAEAESYNGVPVLADAEELLRADLDCCVIAAPTSEHERLACVAARHGVSVLVEKPLAPDLGAARRMAELFDRNGLVGVVGHIERFNPASVALHERLQARQIGDVFQVATRRQGPFPERIRDVGVIMDLATHDLDLTTWVTGSDYSEICAWTAHKSGREHEDLVLVGGRLKSGAIVSHHVNWLSPVKERLTVVTGEGGTLVADTLNADLYFYENSDAVDDWPAMAMFRGVSEGNMTKYALQRTEPLRAEIEAFRDAVLGDAPPEIPFSDGVAAVAVAEWVARAAKGR